MTTCDDRGSRKRLETPDSMSWREGGDQAAGKEVLRTSSPAETLRIQVMGMAWGRGVSGLSGSGVDGIALS